MIGLLISLLILAVVATVIVWLMKYMGAPEILTKIIIVVIVLIALLMLLDAFGVVHTGINVRGPVYNVR